MPGNGEDFLGPNAQKKSIAKRPYSLRCSPSRIRLTYLSAAGILSFRACESRLVRKWSVPINTEETVTNNYTFGDNDRASARLRKLAEVYAPDMRELLAHRAIKRRTLAVDLGCGPGWSTQLLQETISPTRSVGLDASERYIAEARSRNLDTRISFEVHNITQAPFPVSLPDLLFCRFLLTHLSQPVRALEAWASVAAKRAVLLVHETERMETENPSLSRYYELLSQLQNHYGQALQIGTRLENYVTQTPWRLIDSRSLALSKPGSLMAELHVENLRTWRQDSYSRQSFDPDEIDSLELSLERIASGVEEGGTVMNTAKQIVAELIS